MYKLAALTAVVAASPMDDFKETAEMFKIHVRQDEVQPLFDKKRALQKEAM
jgi:hypothetical protein